MAGKVHPLVCALFAAAMLGACTQRDTNAGAPAAPEHGYTLDLFAHETEKIYLVRSADGRAAAGRVTADGSALMDAGAAQALMPQTLVGDAPEDARISIRAPGFSMQINAEESAPGADGRARIDINAGGHRVFVDAEGEGGEGRAAVHITGADVDDARAFIDDADGLSAETRAQMRAALGL
ncbi:MAG: hypothetical protein HXY28_01915 [Hydrogenophilaceae bacterium]|jgi:hypothetical protein|nr:hypothetical protein [Hydrogenophilaceae bacterium]